MDTSKEYIKMCEKAAEIQSKYLMEIGTSLGDCVQYTKDRVTGVIVKYVEIESWDDKKCYEAIALCGNEEIPVDHHFIWLPRQDQLQEMVKGDFIETCDYICHFSEKFVELKSPEKILLKIVMEENHHKTWNGEEWIETN